MLVMLLKLNLPNMRVSLYVQVYPKTKLECWISVVAGSRASLVDDVVGRLYGGT